MYTIGIDIGTTNCKVCLFEIPSLELINQYSFRTPKIVDGEDTDFDVRLIWDGVLHGLRTITNILDNAGKISAVAVASVGEAGVLLDDNDNVIGPVLTWYDTRPKQQLENIISAMDIEHIYEITGIPAHSNYSINKIKWLKDNISNASEGRKWLCLAEYIAFKLSGVKRSEYSLASRTMALNIAELNWDEQLINAAELSPSLFSPLVQAGEAIGTVTSGVSELTGLTTNTRVAIAGHDHMCGSVAVGLTSEDQILNSTGTTEGLLVVTEAVNNTGRFFRARVSNGVHVLPGLHSLYASLPSAGYAIEWFRNLFELDMPAFLRMVDTLRNEQDMAMAGALDGVFIPHLRGSGPPDRNTWSRALIYGLDDKSRPEDILRFVFQGLCFELRNLLDLYETLTGKDYPVVNVIGAACKNPYWLQLKANILNREILACNVNEAVSKGAAMLAAKAAGVEVEFLPGTNGEQTCRYLPEIDAVAHYQAIYTQVYKPLYESKMRTERLCNGVN
ncbi:FGGY-family carbohydrate kinase [Klebsiella pneumoniae]|uniref:FGGY-family carbohydrate kinase n=1 Tax=Klebsiella pneumoniae TaxID=573 RepID=UPI00238091A3|nr:FGGY family carbohydrate kinase [Klebsiella pneumoniae]MDE4782468.1 FGGY family carbohydrate kinase [Klebsiella pneumoniae]